jgi:transcriptional regulator with GAF, ATPase, and Fis domain
VKILIDCPICGNDDVELDIKNGIRETLDNIEKQIVIKALTAAEGNRAKAARRLGMNVWALRHLVEKHNLLNETFS